MFELASEYSVEHVALAEAADVVVIAPATANTIARLAAGIADDMLSTVVLATEAPVIVAPAMNDNMYRNSVTQKNVQLLKARGFTFIEPEQGRLLPGKIGKGGCRKRRLSSKHRESNEGDLEGKRIVVTAGGTQSLSTPCALLPTAPGKMGCCRRARDRSAGNADKHLLPYPRRMAELLSQNSG
jgi:phosphopantothenoylcysteine decarboxylase/phosphopantothenate--cysteine ligase